MSDFKDALRRDIENVFHNTDEFAENVTFTYDGREYTAPVVLDFFAKSDNRARSPYVSDYSQGIHRDNAVLYINERDVDFIPRQGARLEISDDTYYIRRVDFECGEIILRLQKLDE